MSEEESYYAIKEMESLSRHLEEAEKEINKLQQENQQLKILIEDLQLGVTLNEEQERLLDKILFRSGNNE